MFPLPHSWLLITSLVLAIAAILLFAAHQRRWSLACLFSSGIFVRLYVAWLDPFLHDWDERFHALVARNLMHHPFTPMLRVNDWIPYDYRVWCCNHIWLHKQPLFMWQMALSMKIFGVSEYAIRYPGVLMGGISILLVYRISKLMTSNAHIAFIAALLTCFSYFNLELISGRYGMDQNDVAFDFYVLCSIWAYAEYTAKQTVKYALLAGLLAGCAVLNKWLPGILVFSAWGIVILVNGRKGHFLRDAGHYLIALLACAAVFVPWQIYTLHMFPEEAKYELTYNGLHFTQVVEGHGGKWDFYLNNFDSYFSGYLRYVLPLGLLLALILRQYRNQLVMSVMFYFVFALVFYSVAQSKGHAYFMMVVPLGFIFIAVGIFHVINIRHAYRYAFVPATVAAALLEFNLAGITTTHDPQYKNNLGCLDWTTKAYNTQIYKNFSKQVPSTVKYALLVKDHIDFMFYNNNVDAYFWMPAPEDIDKVKRRHEPIAIYLQPDEQLPSFLANYDSLYVLHVKFMQ